MKTITTTLILVLCSVFVYAQAPHLINYQGLIRDGSGNLISNESVGLKFTIVKNSIDTVYVEEHITATNQYGIVNLIIGSGNIISGTILNIDWGNGIYDIVVALDPGT